MAPFLAATATAAVAARSSFGWLLPLLLSRYLVIPSWEQLESKIPSIGQPTRTFREDSLLDQNTKNGRLVLYRDKQGVCPLSEQVWLALELKNIDYLTVLVDKEMDNIGLESDYASLSPVCLEWPDGVKQTDVMEILERLEEKYPGNPNFFPSISVAVDSVRCNIVRFQGVFPRNTLANWYAPYLIKKDASSLVDENQHLVTLEETDEVLDEYDDGNYLCGDKITAADIVWAPFLERYAAQLPLIFEGDDMTPRSSEYETLKEWYEAMEERVPAYVCRVMGDKKSWERYLQKGVQEGKVPCIQEDDLLPSRGKAIPTNRPKLKAENIWKQYASTRPHVADTPELECVSFYVRNRDAIIADATKDLSNMSADEIEGALREVLAALMEGADAQVVAKLSGNARELATYLDEKLCVPRDMGVLPASVLRTLALAAPKPRIASR